MAEVGEKPITLGVLKAMKAADKKFAMLTAYDYPLARLAQAAGVHSLLVGDSLGMVVLGHETTRSAPLGLMVTLAEAVRRGAPDIFLVGDIPFESMTRGLDGLRDAAYQFLGVGCNAIKFEAESHHDEWVAGLRASGIDAIVHLGLRPQSIQSPDQYKAQARDTAAIEALVADARRMESAGAAMLLLEAVSHEAGRAVVEAVSIPVIGCGAGPACAGHVVVTHDMLGFNLIRPPRFVPVLGDAERQLSAAMREYVDRIVDGRYPGPEHQYRIRAESSEN